MKKIITKEEYEKYTPILKELHPLLDDQARIEMEQELKSINFKIDFSSLVLKKEKPLEVFRVTKTELIHTLIANKNKLVRITFVKEDKTVRSVTGQFNNHLSELGYYQFRTMKEGIKQFDAKRLLEVRVNRKIYKLK